nr:Spy/CpxP family protein refolding chaperone [uncultured Allomuricauda sp.]
MKKNLLLGLLLLFLVVMNGILLFMLFGQGPERRPPGPPGDFIVKELRFDENQMQEFRKLSKAHFKSMRVLDEQSRRLKDELFNGIGDKSFTTGQADSITTLIAQLSKDKELNVFNHFKEVGEICTPEQKAKLDKIISKALHRHRKGMRPH